MSYHIILFYMIWYYVLLYYIITLRYFRLYYSRLYYISIVYYVILYYTILYYIIYYIILLYYVILYYIVLELYTVLYSIHTVDCQLIIYSKLLGPSRSRAMASCRWRRICWVRTSSVSANAAKRCSVLAHQTGSCHKWVQYLGIPSDNLT